MKASVTFGALVWSILPTRPSPPIWTMGDDANFTIRSMSNPNAFGHPDTYLGQHWYAGGGDNGGVHYNSGVLNHWFYLLSIGKTGVNDNGDNYAVTGIGIEKAARIAYRTESVYLTANSQYKDARTYSIQAAIDLFGAGSPEVAQTVNAWYAVGVYDLTSIPTNLTATTVSGTQINLNWTDNATHETAYRVERSTSASTGFTEIASLGANVTTYQDQGLDTDAIYYYRVRAVMGATNTKYSNTASATVGVPPIVMRNGSIATCNAVFLDPGGTSNYPDNQYLVMTFTPAASGNKVRVSFSSFDTEPGNDYLRIYDGNNTSAPLVGTYSGNTVPPVITATNASGELTFSFSSNYATNRLGWQAVVSCVTPPATPVNLVAITASATQINLSWTDNATDETGYLIERSATSGMGFAQIAVLGPNVTTYSNTGLATDAQYYYRIRAVKGDTHSAYSNEATAMVGNPPIIMSNSTITTCEAVFLDPGGTGNYGANQNVTMVFTPATAGKKISITFSSFNTEYGYDYLSIYDGATTSARLIGSYSGSSLPPIATATNAAGQLTFRFYSDGVASYAGWQANVSCVTMPNIPSALTASAASGTQINLSWTDNASDEAGFKIERSTAQSAGFMQIGTVGPNIVSYSDAGLPTNAIYYYRIRAYSGNTHSDYSNVASAMVGNAPILMQNGSVTTCNTSFMDSGGNGSYNHYENFTLTVTPTDTTQKLRITFSAFNTESCCDYLSVYDGATTGARLIGSYAGDSLPPVLTATHSRGQVPFRFASVGRVRG